MKDDLRFYKTYNLIMEALNKKKNANETTKEQFSDDFSSLLENIINDIKNEFSNIKGINSCGFKSKAETVNSAGNNNYVIKVPNSIRNQVMEKMSEYFMANIGPEYEFKINDINQDEKNEDYDELENQPNEIKNVQSTKSSAGEIKIPTAAKDMEDEDEKDFYQFNISIVAKPSDGARSISGDDINTNLTELLPCIYWNYPNHFSSLTIESVIESIKGLTVEDISNCFLDSDTGGPGKASALLKFLSEKIDSLEKPVKKIVFDKIKVSFSIYSKMVELYSNLKGNQCIWTAKKKPEGYDNSPADLMIKADDTNWVEISLKAGSASSHPHLLNTSINEFLKFLQKTFKLNYSLSKLFLEIINNPTLVDKEERIEIIQTIKKASSDFSEGFEINPRSSLNNVCRRILNEKFGSNKEKIKNIIKFVVSQLYSKIDECCQGNNKNLIIIVKYLLNLSSVQNSFVILKGFPNGSPAEILRPDADKLIFKKIGIQITDNGLLFNGFEFNSIKQIEARPRTSGTGIPGFFNFSFRVK